MNRRSFLLGVVLVACAKTDEPADPVWGKEPCAHCAMLVSDPRFAAQIGGDGERKYFDDVGCMASWLEKHQAKRVWVHEDGKWVDAKSARYLSGASTPMDFGFVPTHDDSGIGWQELRERVRARERASR